MVELAAHLSFGFDSFRPMHDHPVAGAAEMTGHLLSPLKGRVARPGPADREMRKGRRPAPILDVIHHLIGFADDAVERHHLIVGAFGSAFGARAVVADDVKEERVIQRAHSLQLRHQPAYFMVGMLRETGESFHLAFKEPFLLCAHLVPGGNLLGARG